MPGRASRLMLAAGFLVVLVLAIGLVQLTRSATQAATPPIPARGSTTTPSAPVAEPAAAPAIERVRAPQPGPPTSRGAVSSTSPVRPPELAPAPARFDRELKRDADGKLVPIIPLHLLREQLHVTDAPMKACLERAGQHPTGKATLSFTVAANNHKLVIESTGIQDEETLAAYPDLLECMHRTANLFVLDGHAVPELGTPIYVRRHVRIEDGALAENTLFNFSYAP